MQSSAVDNYNEPGRHKSPVANTGDGSGATLATRTSVASDATDRGANGAALVHRKQSYPPLKVEARRERYTRRSASSEWLIRLARREAGLVAVAEGDVDPESGELLPVTAKSKKWVRPPRPARCSWRIAQTVPVHSDGSRAHFSGTERCGSVWTCPVCASVIRAERSREIISAVEQHQVAGGSVVLLTLTARHYGGDPLSDVLDGVMKSWQRLLRGKAWAMFKGRWGVHGYIRSIEVTHGVNGWHPHVHALLLLDKRITKTETTSIGDEVHGRWSRYIHERTGRMPTRRHGVDVQCVDGDGKVLAEYIAKMQDTGSKWDVGAELARSDVKSGRGATSVVPFELLDKPVDENGSSEWARKLWVEYYQSTKGRRAITWSKGLKDKFDLNELTDDEIIDDAETAPVRWLAEGKSYDQVRRSDASLLAVALEAAERDDWAMVRMILPGSEPPN